MLDQTAHRPWPLPEGPWAMAMQWHDLLFAHWPVPVEALRQRVPPALDLDTYEGQAWVGVVPFGMSGVRPRRAPPLPWVSAFPELNVRTYVTAGGKPGVFFFSLDAGNPLIVEVARTWYRLPYFRASMSLRREAERVHYRSVRTDRRASGAGFAGRYGPAGDVYRASPGSLASWLTERYCLYAVDAAGRIYRGEIHHAPWPLQTAEAELETNTMTQPIGIQLAGSPLLHFARRLEVVAWPLREV